jgi:hypothetical protein
VSTYGDNAELRPVFSRTTDVPMAQMPRAMAVNIMTRLNSLPLLVCKNGNTDFDSLNGERFAPRVTDPAMNPTSSGVPLTIICRLPPGASASPMMPTA